MSIAGLVLLTAEHLSQAPVAALHVIKGSQLGIATTVLAVSWMVARLSKAAKRRVPTFRALLLLADGKVHGLDASGGRTPLQVRAFHRTAGLLWLQTESSSGIANMLSGRTLTGDPTWAKVMAWLTSHRRRFGAW